MSDDIFVTEKDLKITSKIVNNERLPKCFKYLRARWDYNCWGFTAFALKWIEKLYWVNREDMDNFLEENTKRISHKNIKEGDIVVYRAACLYGERNYLLHTALIINTKIDEIIHKDGDYPLEKSGIYNTEYNSKYDNLKITFRRVKIK